MRPTMSVRASSPISNSRTFFQPRVVVTLGLVAIATCGLAAAHRAQTDSDWRETSPLGHQQRGTAGQPTQSADDIAPSAPPTRWSTGNEFQEALQQSFDEFRKGTAWQKTRKAGLLLV